MAVPSRILADIRMRRSFLRLAGRPHRRRGPVPRQTQPDAIRLSYFRALLQVLAQAKALVERATPKLKEIVERAAAARGDSRLDDDPDDPNDLIDGLSDEFFGEFTNTKLSDLAKGYGQRTSDFNRLELGRQFKSALGIDIVKAEPWLEPKIQTFTRENVALIKSIPNRYFDDVEKQVIGGMRQGLRWEEIAKDLDRRFEVAEGHAKLVARDQVGKFFGDLNRTRQEELGVTSFIWRTARDNRVREEHQELEGEEFTWANPPAEGIPGEPINCRCQAEPVMKPLIDAVKGEEQPEPTPTPSAPTPVPVPVPAEVPIPAPAPAPAWAGWTDVGTTEAALEQLATMTGAKPLQGEALKAASKAFRGGGMSVARKDMYGEAITKARRIDYLNTVGKTIEDMTGRFPVVKAALSDRVDFLPGPSLKKGLFAYSENPFTGERSNYHLSFGPVHSLKEAGVQAEFLKERGHKWTVGDFTVAGNTRHEIGHLVDRAVKLDRRALEKEIEQAAGSWAAAREWIRKNVSEYATTNIRETFAELTCMVTSPSYTKGTLPKSLEEFMFGILKAKK